ncbi:hypothetical protein ACOSQ4_031218 [Xanthoceras sorbifolium]
MHATQLNVRCVKGWLFSHALPFSSGNSRSFHVCCSAGANKAVSEKSVEFDEESPTMADEVIPLQENCQSSKRVHSTIECEVPKKTMGESFKFKLLNMTDPSNWVDFRAYKEYFDIEQGDFDIEQSDITFSDSLTGRKYANGINSVGKSSVPPRNLNDNVKSESGSKMNAGTSNMKTNVSNILGSGRRVYGNIRKVGSNDERNSHAGFHKKRGLNDGKNRFEVLLMTWKYCRKLVLVI